MSNDMTGFRWHSKTFAFLGWMVYNTFALDESSLSIGRDKVNIPHTKSLLVIESI